MDRAQGAGQGQFLLGQIDGDDGRGAAGERAQDAGQTHAAQADDDDALARLDPSGVHHGADAGQDGAAEQGRLLERQGRVDLHQRPARDHGVFGEGGTAQVVVDGLALAENAAGAGQQLAPAIGGGAGFAQGGAAAGARVAMTAGGHEDHDDVIADGQIRHPFAQGLDHPGRLVPQGHGQGAGPVAVDDGKVRMAQARRLDRDPDLARAGRVQLDGLDRQGAAVGVGPGGAHLRQDGGAGGQGHRGFPWRALSASAFVIGHLPIGA